LSPDLTLDGLPAQDSVVSIGTNALVLSQLNGPLFDGRQWHAITTPIVSHAIGIRILGISMADLRPHLELGFSWNRIALSYGSGSSRASGSHSSGMHGLSIVEHSKQPNQPSVSV
jgi:hypothetical protein